MKKKHSPFSLIMSIILCGSLFVSCAGDSNTLKNSYESVLTHTEVKSASNTVKVLQEEDISNFSSPTLYYEAAKGESEGAQLIICPDADIKYDIQISDLKSTAGDIISSSCIIPYVQIYTYTAKGFTGFPSGYYPDALISFEYIKKFGENQVKKGENQGFWFDLSVPSDAEAGDYSGTVTLTIGAEKEVVPINVTVYDFVLEQSDFKIIYAIWQEWLIDGELDNTLDKYTDYYEFMADFKLAGDQFPVVAGDINAFIKCLRKYYDGTSCYRLPFEGAEVQINGKSYVSINYDLLNDYLIAILNACQEDNKNYFEKMYYNWEKVYDEVSEDRYPGMIDAIEKTDLTEERAILESGIETSSIYAQTLLNTKHLITQINGWQDIFEQYPQVSVWPLYNNIGTTKDVEFYDDLIESGHEIGRYFTVNPWPNAAAMIDDYLLTSRDTFWYNFDAGITGDLYWNVNAYVNYGTPIEIGYDRVTDFYRESSRDNVTNGDGFLVYPGTLYDSDKPFPSLRLVSRRDGVEDYGYLSMLEKKYLALAEEYGVSNEKIHEVFSTMIDSLISVGRSKLNHDGLQNIRRTIAHLIELADSEAALLLSEFSFDETSITIGYTAKEEVALNGNIEKTTSVSGNGNYAKVILSYSGNEEIEISVGELGRAILYCGKTPDLIASFDTENFEAELEQFIVNTKHGSTMAINSDVTYSISRNSLKTVLKGNAMNATYRPYIRFEVDNVEEIEAVTFWIYNAENADLEISIYAVTDLQDYALDTMILKANSWRKVTLDNFMHISTDSAKLQTIGSIMISTANLVSNGKEYSHTLYIDSVYQKMK